MDVGDIVTNEQAFGIAEKVSNFYDLALGVGAVLALGIIVYAGVLYTMSGGSSDRINSAKKWIWAALGGLGLLFGAFLFLGTINPNLLELTDPTYTQNPFQDVVTEEVPIGGGGDAYTTCIADCAATGRTPDSCAAECQGVGDTCTAEGGGCQLSYPEACCSGLCEPSTGGSPLVGKCAASPGDTCTPLAGGCRLVDPNCCGSLVCEPSAGNPLIGKCAVGSGL